MAVQSFRLLLLISSRLRIMISFWVMIQILSFSVTMSLVRDLRHLSGSSLLTCIQIGVDLKMMLKKSAQRLTI